MRAEPDRRFLFFTNAMTDELSFLRSALPECDRVSVSVDALRSIVRHCAAVRAIVPWGASIPEDVFRAYVLFPRVNTESPSAYHEPLWAQLRERVSGQSMEAAVQAVNLWCAESVEYAATDDRTNAPLDTLRRTWGRCGEESVLLVSALRACCIPARQVYVPWWSHCDDNHAWVEAWVDGSWRYLGACEPEPELDSGWFTAAASRAMLVHTKVWGQAPAGDEVCGEQFGAFVVNRTAAYAKTARLTVLAAANGAPLPGLTVRFELANLGALRPIHTAQTDADGLVRLTLGLGSLRVHLTDGVRFLARTVELREDAVLAFDWSEASAEIPAEDFCQRPPLETKIQPAPASPEVRLTHEARLRACAAARAAKRAAFFREPDYLARACGNSMELRAFLADTRFSGADKAALLDTLREKDFADATAATLVDYLCVALPFRSRWPEEIWQHGVLAPRVANEKLLPVRQALRSWFRADPPDCAASLWDRLRERIAVLPGRDLCVPDLRGVMRSGRCSAATLDVLFVACARALGFAARLNPATGIKEIWDGAWRALTPETAVTGTLRLENPGCTPLTGGVDFGLERLENGLFVPLDLDGLRLTGTHSLTLPAGGYRLAALTRRADGTVDGRLRPIRVQTGATAAVPVLCPPRRLPEGFSPVRLPELETSGGPLLSGLRGKNAIVVLLAPAEEPSVHFLNELQQASERDAAVRVLLLPGADPAWVQPSLAAWQDACVLTLPEDSALLPWRRALHAGELRLPFAAAVDRAGRGVFAITNYQVGAVRTLLDLLRQTEDQR